MYSHGKITITSDSDQPSIDVPLTGVGEGPSISVDSSALIKAWPDEPDGITLIVKNKGKLPLSIWGYNLQGPDINDFKFGNPSNCGDRALQPLETCSITVDYKPLVPANPSDFVKLIISSNDPVNPAAEVQIEGTTPDIITENVNLQAGWSLISLPLIPITKDRRRDSASSFPEAATGDRRIKTLFPDAEAVFDFTTRYNFHDPNDQLEMRKGYWIYLPEAQTYTVTGPLSCNIRFLMHQPAGL